MLKYTGQELATWSGGQWDPAAPAALENICHDTRELRDGDVYLALKGEQFDGHSFVSDAFARGAVGAIVAADAGLQSALAQPLLRVADPHASLRAMAAGYSRRVNPSMIGVTGSAGKTTVKELIAQMLSLAVPTASTRGNWNNDIGLPMRPLGMHPDARAGVFEVGTSSPGEIADLAALLEPDVGLVTNVGEAHLEFFGSVEAIAREKGSLLSSLSPDGIAIINLDGGQVDILRACAKCRIITVSTKQTADYSLVKRAADGSRAVVQEGPNGERTEIPIPLPGEHNLSNVLLAVAVVRMFGVTWRQVMAGLDGFQNMPLRWDEQLLHGVRIVNDAYNANPLSMAAAIDAFGSESCEGQRWLVLGEMLELGDAAPDLHRELGRTVATGPWAGVCLLGDGGTWIAEGVKAASGDDRFSLFECADHAMAAQILHEHLADGDAVFLKGSRRARLEDVVKLYIQTEE